MPLIPPGFDWTALTPLRLRARVLADGLLLGTHGSRRRGAGLEFAGHRAYVPGDDLRFLDQRAVLRQDRLLIKQFDTDTERGVVLCVDASASMGFRSPDSKCTKYEYAALLGAALARIAARSGDPVGLRYWAGQGGLALPPRGGALGFERCVHSLEGTQPHGGLPDDSDLEQQLGMLHHSARRGSLIVLLSDLLDLPEDAPQRIAALSLRKRQMLVIQVLDPMEARFTLEGPVRLRSPEHPERHLDTTGARSRDAYLAALAALQAKYRTALEARGGDFCVACSDEHPIEVLRRALQRTMRAA